MTKQYTDIRNYAPISFERKANIRRLLQRGDMELSVEEVGGRVSFYAVGDSTHHLGTYPRCNRKIDWQDLMWKAQHALDAESTPDVCEFMERGDQLVNSMGSLLA